MREGGLYQLIFKSIKPEAKQFREWLSDEVLPCIRQYSCYPAPRADIIPIARNPLEIRTEYDLQKVVVNYIRKYQPDLVTVASLGELQTSESSRIYSSVMGYTAGTVDLLVLGKNKLPLLFEFKSPTGKGVISDAQSNFHKKMTKMGYKVIVSNCYDDIVIELNKYNEKPQKPKVEPKKLTLKEKTISNNTTIMNKKACDTYTFPENYKHSGRTASYVMQNNPDYFNFLMSQAWFKDTAEYLRTGVMNDKVKIKNTPIIRPKTTYVKPDFFQYMFD